MPISDCERNMHPVQEIGQTEATAEDAVCGLNALIAAGARTRRNVGYKNSVSRFHLLLLSKCNELKHELYDETYRPQKGEPHEVFEPKYRITVSARYRDRIPQSSFITNYFYPTVIPHLIQANCSCLKGRGVDYARNILKDMLRHSSMDDWCLKVDMKSYFASIDHDILCNEMWGYIKDDWARWFFRLAISNASNSVGIDLGSEVYQLSATAFLNRLDHKLEKMGKYVRYQDDLLFLGTKEECKEALKVVRQEVERLKLKVSEKKTYIQPIKRPIQFLGFTFLKHSTGRITLKRLPCKIRHEKRKLRRMWCLGVPVERMLIHYQGVRECLRKGARSDLMKMDKYFNSIIRSDRNADYS